MLAQSDALPPCPFCGHDHGEDTLKCPESDMVLPLEGRLLGGKFRLSRQLGAGGMATVWLALNTLVDRPVAIKLIRPEVIRDADVVARFRSEAKAAGRIGHPNVCDILDFGTSPVGPYIVMEFLQGRNLGQAIVAEGKLDVIRALTIVRQALAGLHAAHERGVIHRDLKPENIFLHQRMSASSSGSGNSVGVKLMDFGVAKFTDGTGEIETGKGALLGTPEYMAPEQFAGAELVEPRTDVWAVGAILYRALTGEHAFRGPTVAATLFKTTQEPHRPMRELDPTVPIRLERAIDRCLEKKPAARFPTVKALDDELRAILEELGVADVAPALDAVIDDEDRIGPILIGPPSLSEVVDAIAAESLPGTAAPIASDGPTPVPPRTGIDPVVARPVQPHGVRDSAPTLNHERTEALESLRAAAESEPPPSEARHEVQPPVAELDDGVPDPVEDATTGIANPAGHRDPFDAPRPVSAWPLALVGAMLALFGWGAWSLIRSETAGRDDATLARHESSDVPPAPSEPSAPPSLAAHDEAHDPGQNELQSDAHEDEGGSSSGPLVDDPPPGEDEVIEILDDEPDDPEALADALDTEGGMDPPEQTETPAIEPVIPPTPPDAEAKAGSSRAPAAAQEAPPPPAGTVMTDGYIASLQPWAKMDQNSARKHCKALAKDGHLGVTRWKLANPAVAKKFSPVAQMKRGRYWTTARYKGRAWVVEVPTAKSASMRVSRKFRPLCIARWP